ncbi:MAG: hypothetical protein HYU37_07710 [Acidobacteria bacterium]|nr:hypothetical protein [Acidobacteriota bacterium]
MALRPLAALLVLSGAAAAYDTTLGPQAIAEAIRIGESRIDRVHVDYHRPYRIDVRRPPVDYVELVTPFRRVVLASEERLRQGGRSFRQQEAQAVAAARGNPLEVFVELTFHPQNAYVGVPPYEVRLMHGSPETALLPQRLQRVPRSGPRLETGPTRSPYPAAPWLADGQPVLGGTVIASFDAARLDDRARYDVVIVEKGKELARASVDLASLR